MLLKKNINLKIPFSVPFIHGTESAMINSFLEGKLDDPKHRCLVELTKLIGTQNILLTGSCSQALEMAVLASGVELGDEVILPSFTYTSTANAIIAAGGVPVFVDCEKGSLNVLPGQIESAITKKTKAVIVMHYAGISCDLPSIVAICKNNNIKLIEDAAQCIDTYLEGKHLGTFGDFGTISFHKTKNIHCYKGGALIYKNPNDNYLLNQFLYHGTNRLDFLAGKVDQYSWVSKGSSNYLSDLAACFLLAQIKEVGRITEFRRSIWNEYFNGLQSWSDKGFLTLPELPVNVMHNGHIFHFCVNDSEIQKSLIAFLGKKGVSAYFHYQPLHKSIAGIKYGRFEGQDIQTTKCAESLIRLPIHMNMEQQDALNVLDIVDQFFNSL